MVFALQLSAVATHIQGFARLLLSNGGQQGSKVDHPVNLVVDHNRMKVLQIQNISIHVRSWKHQEERRFHTIQHKSYQQLLNNQCLLSTYENNTYLHAEYPLSAS